MSAGPVVLKFGGTSVGDAEAIGRLVRHVSAAHAHAGAVVVVSALSGVTDRLLSLAATAAAAAATDETMVQAGVAELQQRHEQVARLIVADAEAAVPGDRGGDRRVAQPAPRDRDAQGRLAAGPRRRRGLRRAAQQPDRPNRPAAPPGSRPPGSMRVRC